jgi:hypothetical protein
MAHITVEDYRANLSRREIVAFYDLRLAWSFSHNQHSIHADETKFSEHQLQYESHRP